MKIIYMEQTIMLLAQQNPKMLNDLIDRKLRGEKFLDGND